MKIEKVANVLKVLGHPKRLIIYKNVVESGALGISVGELKKRLNIPSSTLSHHIACLIAVGLLSQRREGEHCFVSLSINIFRRCLILPLKRAVFMSEPGTYLVLIMVGSGSNRLVIWTRKSTQSIWR
ncbi:ArsR/SmtB family transcription factor [Dongshaea marina]|uniref:ArsR/SmtB family transcription factor n=1 Tax=Dongshaea marina TaxID=2047966 RepID=UPI002D793229|nr:helix-turn-helix domain-containing protein [Dongshaea marina]